MGRKNWLFCGSDRGAHAAAVHFSLIASCRRHGVDPFAYLRDILTQLPISVRARPPSSFAHCRPIAIGRPEPAVLAVRPCDVPYRTLTDQWPDLRMLPDDFVFPDHADWQFVESCLEPD